MREQRIDRFASARDDVEHAFRQSGFFQKLNDQKRGERNFFARLENECVAANKRERKHPHRDHRRKIEWRNADANAEWLQHCLAIDAAYEILESIAHEQSR